VAAVRYLLQCYRCLRLGSNLVFGYGWNRQCPDCGSYEIHAVDTTQPAENGRYP
jgi:hypothetical protein